MVLKAVQSGINFIDTSPWYGQGVSEERLGIALKNVPRDKYYIATKVSYYKPLSTVNFGNKNLAYGSNLHHSRLLVRVVKN